MTADANSNQLPTQIAPGGGLLTAGELESEVQRNGKPM